MTVTLRLSQPAPLGSIQRLEQQLGPGLLLHSTVAVGPTDIRWLLRQHQTIAATNVPAIASGLGPGDAC